MAVTHSDPNEKLTRPLASVRDDDVSGALRFVVVATAAVVVVGG
eukprot:COSAG01_NODE_44815_length_415_cov_0.965190_1_plen_43_part_10